MPLVTAAAAVELLRRGDVVALPTETVYGLAGNALDTEVVRRIFEAKGRPANHPLILHALNPRPYARFDARAEALSALWPGPLTLVLPRHPVVPDAVTGGFETVAVRVPDHPLLNEILRALSFPLAAPSANRFGAVSPTTAEHVLASFPDLAVVDGGPCSVGVESTIVDLSQPSPSILRPGAISREEVELALDLQLVARGGTVAPGTLPAHYSPVARVLLVPDAVAAAAKHPGSVAIVRRAPAEYARTLYASLREADLAGASVIYAELAEPTGIGIAVNDRLERAAYAGATPRR